MLKQKHTQLIELSALHKDPYPVLTQLQKKSAFARVEGAMFAGMGWSHVVTRYETVAALLRDPRLSSDMANNDSWINLKTSRFTPKTLRSILNSMLTSDAPDHIRLRKLAAKSFKPSFILSLEKRIENITDEILTDMEGSGVVDLAERFSLQIPLIVISEMLGIPKHQHDEFRKYASEMFRTPPKNLINILKLTPSMWRVQKFFSDLVELKKSEPGDDLTTLLISAEEGGDRLNKSELVGMLYLLLFAGHETTANLLSSGILALLQHPDQLEKYKSNPNVIDSMIEEMLRYTNPVQHAMPRIAKEDLNVEGNLIKKGETLLLFVAAANRDKSIFSEPEKFDITRSPNKHLAFGVGVHFCLGAPLARLEAKVALTRILERYPDMQLAIPNNELKWRKTMFLRSLERLPIRLRPSF